jgi:hypothetical protein
MIVSSNWHKKHQIRMNYLALRLEQVTQTLSAAQGAYHSIAVRIAPARPVAIFLGAVQREGRKQWLLHATRLPTVPIASRRPPAPANGRHWQVPGLQLLRLLTAAITSLRPRPMVAVVARDCTARTWCRRGGSKSLLGQRRQCRVRLSQSTVMVGIWWRQCFPSSAWDKVSV